MNFIKPRDWKDPTQSEIDLVTQILGKEPQSEFRICVSNEDGSPLVIENMPFFKDGTPMPTRYWLLPSPLYNLVSKVESAGGIKQVQDVINIEDISKIHLQYEKNRDVLIDTNYEGPKPSGGVGGTRIGVKCLHAHVANLLAGNDDVVGQWTLNQIEIENDDQSSN